MGGAKRLTMARRGSRPAGEGGQEMVEFAILLPLLLLVALGVLDLGRAFFAAITITNAARVGARFGMEFPSDNAGIIAATRAEAQGSGIVLTDPTTSAIAVSCPDVEGCVSNHPIRVTVTYDFSLISGFLFPDPEIPIIRFAEMLIP